MKVAGTHYRTIWEAGETVAIIDQRRLPHDFTVVALASLHDAAVAIRDMWVRGAPLIGATAAHGVALHMARDPSDAGLEEACAVLRATRPTAVNLMWALDDMRAYLAPLAPGDRRDAARARARALCDEDVAINRAIGDHGLGLLREIAARKGRVNVLTHCNAGWLATVDWGTATAPIYRAAEEGLDIHVWVDETRPRNQGAHLTAWELAGAGIPHTLVVDNAGGHLMQRGQVDIVITGTDRTTATGDVCNKIGTYLKALAAHENGVPFHVALPSPTIDWTLRDGLREIEIEERGAEEVTHLDGLGPDGPTRIRIAPEATPAANPAFDVTPARLVTGLITERGLCPATEAGLAALFPDRVRAA
ncbi:S-methyl-5-thioribose-1-phosphate isomerase [Rhodobaculum claviforme]|uniref:Methylthioribose-1-phosphate isomerase n=1 Tax=Rhodobaculum claviforme TaxID=1549854 RepID=A0A934TJF1_9RHOB|nr:S-methyl-5-thioribose-1-phosphate isomerase [Rhodobaculum claviforme]MBK5926917.1 S-methyl-5-thioribose-1-phosphate isomerase [Rhodobaculum claviforme]